MVIFVDFDGTLHYESPGSFDLWSDPNCTVVEAIREYKEEGHEIVIYSCRSNPNICPSKAEELMIKWLDKHEVPYDRIEPNKPLFDVLIDDRAINPETMGTYEDRKSELKLAFNKLYPEALLQRQREVTGCDNIDEIQYAAFCHGYLSR